MLTWISRDNAADTNTVCSYIGITQCNKHGIRARFATHRISRRPRRSSRTWLAKKTLDGVHVCGCFVCMSVCVRKTNQQKFWRMAYGISSRSCYSLRSPRSLQESHAVLILNSELRVCAYRSQLVNEFNTFCPDLPGAPGNPLEPCGPYSVG